MLKQQREARPPALDLIRTREATAGGQNYLALWTAVIAQAITDATKEPTPWEAAMKCNADIAKDAMQFLFSPSSALPEIAQKIGIDPVALRRSLVTPSSAADDPMAWPKKIVRFRLRWLREAEASASEVRQQVRKLAVSNRNLDRLEAVLAGAQVDGLPRRHRRRLISHEWRASLSGVKERGRPPKAVVE